MSTLPRLLREQISFFETHLTLWSADPARFGLSAGQIAALTAALADARRAHGQVQVQKTALATAVMAQGFAAKTMLSLGRSAIATIKVTARVQENNGILYDAGLNAASTSRTAPAPLPPRRIWSSVNSLGGIELFWKTRQPAGLSGVIYSIRRSIDGGAWTLLDAVGGKRFTDSTVPVGTQRVEYTIRPRHGETLGEASAVQVLVFGSVRAASAPESPGRALTAAVVPSARGTKFAA